MAEGTNVLLVCSLLILLLSPSKAEVSLTSGLVFDRTTHQEVPVNGRKLSFSRAIDVAPLYSALEKFQRATTLYASACKTATTKLDEKNHNYKKTKEERSRVRHDGDLHYLNTNDKHYLRVASAACQTHHGRLPEIRNSFDFIHIKGAVNQHRIVPANIYFDQQAQRLRYVSDDTEPHLTTYRFYSYLDQYGQEQKHVNYHFLQAARQAKMYYTMKDDKVFIGIMTEEQMEKKDVILCKVPFHPIPADLIPTNTDSMLKMECERDTSYLNNTFNALHYLIHSNFDAAHWPAPNIPSTASSSALLPSVSRTRRMAPLMAVALGIGASAVTGNMMSSSMSGRAPFGWIGSTLGRLAGLVTDDMYQEQWMAIHNQSTKIVDLQLNMQEVSFQFNIIQSAVEQLQQFLVQHDLSITTYLRLKDLSAKTTSLAATIHTATTSLIGAITDSAYSNYNPIMLSKAELNEIKNNISKTRQLEMDIHPNSITTAILRTESGFNVIFILPVIVAEDMAHIYTVSTLPLFFQGKAFRPQPDTKHLAVYPKNTGVLHHVN
jgi:hypothetical protein